MPRIEDIVVRCPYQDEGLKREISQDAVTTWNGAISHATTGRGKLGACLDYWSKAGTFQGREQKLVDEDMKKIFKDDDRIATAIVFGLRLITRKPTVAGIEEVQTGYGRKDEFYKAIRWMAANCPNILYNNLHLIPVFGCWKDFFNSELLSCLDKTRVMELAAANLGDQLLLKYLPQIRSSGSVRSERDRIRSNWAKIFCKFLGLSEREYRHLKSKGQAHIFQRQMNRGEWDAINFNGIPGRAMFHFTTRKNKKDGLTVFERHGQVERLKEWALKQSTIKFTGYPYELVRACGSTYYKPISEFQKFVVNRQFEHLIKPMRNHSLGNVLAALDTSGSMNWFPINGVTAYDICISMGIVFSALNVGYFKDTAVAFADRSRLIHLEGEFTDRLYQIQNMPAAMGSTNFQSVIDLIVDVRKKNPDIPLEEYPETILVISDMQFNPGSRSNTKTNYEVARQKLNNVGLPDMRIIWWYVNGAGTDFPVQMNEKGTYLIGGFDPVNLKALMGLSSQKKDFNASEKKEETPLDGLFNFLTQPIFSLLSFDK